MIEYATAHFSSRELCRSRKAIELGIPNECPEHLNAALIQTMEGCERIRMFLGFPMRISSGFRSPELNKAVGGSKSSQHMKAEAVDFTCPAYGTPVDVVAALAPKVLELGIDQLILEPGWVHVSFSNSPRFEVLVLTGGGRYSRYTPIG